MKKKNNRNRFDQRWEAISDVRRGHIAIGKQDHGTDQAG
jgi:hypothetical protein|tara:strand:- start:4399 stop:4515 length:117 start_codon:yes stop_codon:yes gene_type:complete